MGSRFQYKRLTVILIRPSKYDDEGYVIRHFRGTLPSNTLSCLHSLTKDAIRRGALEGLDVRVETIDEIVSRVDPVKLGRRFRRKNHKVVVGLVGVQTNQFPRAQDLARQFKAEGFDVMIGGFHVSGAIAMSDEMPRECQEALDDGVTLVLGEVEDRWADLLCDAAMDRLQPLYDYLGDKPDLFDRPVPETSLKVQNRFVLRGSGTIDAGRGCPFNCSFCTIINVQGRKMRYRGAKHIIGQIRKNYYLKGKRKGVRHYFFTDDNFSRNPCWEEIFDGLIAMRQDEGMAIDFMMQVDTLAAKIPGFVDKAARAGCVQVFIGMEAIQDDNLAAAGKRQNRSSDYKQMIAQWHAAGVVCHVGYIIGFPNDTYERVMEDVRILRDELLVDQASFFMLTPLPGSKDHQTAVGQGVDLETDYNQFDSFHASMPHPRMSAEEWQRAFDDAWKEFYSPEQMKRSLLRQNPHTYWAVIKNLIWYRASMIEGAHPMITGFFRLKDRKSRRPGFPIESRWSFFKRRARENAAIIRDYTKLYFEMQELWLSTRIHREEYAFLGNLRKSASDTMLEAKTNWGKVHTEVAARLESLRGSIGSHAGLVGSVMSQRIDATLDAVGSRGSALGSFVGDRFGGVRSSLEHSLASAGRSLSARKRALQAGLADLRLKYVPPARPPSLLRRWGRRFNLLAMPRIDTRRHLADYWERTWTAIRRFQFWKLNPFTFTWNLYCDARCAVIFLISMTIERY